MKRTSSKLKGSKTILGFHFISIYSFCLSIAQSHTMSPSRLWSLQAYKYGYENDIVFGHVIHVRQWVGTWRSERVGNNTSRHIEA